MPANETTKIAPSVKDRILFLKKLDVSVSETQSCSRTCGKSIRAISLWDWASFVPDPDTFNFFISWGVAIDAFISNGTLGIPEDFITAKHLN